jgi:DNA-binding ferritin-like protein (Dps family)
MSILSKLTDKVIGDKRRWRAYRARTKRLPANYATAVEGLERYLMYTGPGDGDHLMTMLEDLADLFEQSAASGTAIREVVGDDPVEFAEAFKRNYGLSQWISKEQQRLTSAIERAENQGPESPR